MRAIGLAATIVVLGIFFPRVLGAMEGFLLAVLSKATAFIGSLPGSPF